MFAEIATGIQSLNAAMGLLKTLNAASNQAAINEVKLELQARLFEARDALSAAQDAQATALERIRELEQEIVKLKDWEGEKQRYELREVASGSFAYSLKSTMAGAEPPHWTCPKCYQDGVKSILQKEPGSLTKTHLNIPTTYACARCPTKIAM
jgi:hypothetical protein